ncbi:hypothetical protein LCGC14_0840650 [marine sediment metagenome]|uniref:Uncharacterized protein n=1 Tax=marine sediment metagenome TaxID=412755 RepID=A0A0F9PYI6_9ZZZZ
MKFIFNPAQLSRCQRNSLMEVLGVIQYDNSVELVVTPVEFPLKLKVKLDNAEEMLLGWDDGKQIYADLTKSEPIPESKKDKVDLPGPGPESMTETKQEAELDLAPVVERAEALARALVKLSLPLSVEQRIDVWIKFCMVLAKELWK